MIASAWSRLRESAAARWQAGAPARLSRPAPKGRIDPALAVVTAALLLAGGLAGTALWSIERWRGFLDPPVLRPLPEKRILTDFREETAPIVDAVGLGQGVAMLRSDGRLHLYDFPTELISDGRFSPTQDLSGTPALLSRDCASVSDCAESRGLFLVTDRGGLARGAGIDRWSVVLGDEAWKAPDGTPVEQSDILSSAASADGRWILVAAGSKGLGLFEHRTGGWLAIDPTGAAADITSVRFAGGVFFLAGPRGLARLDPSAGSLVEAVPGADAEILDLNATEDGALVLMRGPCTAGDGCLSILEAGATGPAQRIVGETEHDPNLSDQGANHAALQGDMVIVLGASGVHAYDRRSRGWTRLEPAPVQAMAASADGGIVDFAAGNRVGRIQSGRIVQSRTLADPLVQILQDAAGAAIGLDRAGKVIDLMADPPVALTFADSGMPTQSNFVAGAATAGKVVLLGSQGILLHDTKSRRYVVQQLPPGLQQMAAASGLRMLAQGDGIWLVDPASGTVLRARVQGEGEQMQLVPGASVMLASGLRAVHPDDAGLTVIGPLGDPLQLSESDQGIVVTPLTGAPLPLEMTPETAASNGTDLFFAGNGALWVYSGANRSWDGPFTLPEPGVRDLGFGNTLYALGASGKLYRAGTADWETVTGGGLSAAFAQADLTDARGRSGGILLAGDGKVMRYRPDERKIDAVWTGGKGTVRLLDSPSAPLWLSDGVLRSGEDAVSAADETVVGAWDSAGGPVYMAETNGRRHAAALVGGRNCLFRGVAPPGGQLERAAAMPDGRILALTSAGAGLHDPARRRWIGLPMDGASPETDLAVIAGHVARLDPGRLRWMPVAGIASVDSCSASAPAPDWQIDSKVRGAVIDRAADQVLALGPAGEVIRLATGEPEYLLPAATAGPLRSDLRRVWAQGSVLGFVADDAIHDYDTRARVWTTTAFVNAPPRVQEADAVLARDGRRIVTLWDDGNGLWGGSESGGQVRFDRLELPDLPVVTLPPGEIRDMARPRGALEPDRIGILSDRKVQLADSHRSGPGITLDLPVPGLALASAGGAADLVLTAGPPESPRTLHVVPPDGLGQGGALDRLAWSYSPGNDRGWALGASEVWRVDRDMRLWTCLPKAGQTLPDGCKLSAEAPLAVSRAEVRGHVVLPGEETSVLLLKDRALFLGPDDRVLPETLPPVSEATELLAMNGDVLLLSAPGGELWRVEGRSGRLVSPEVLAVRDSRGQTFAELPSGLHSLENGILSKFAEADDGTALAAATLADGTVYGVDPEGRPRSALRPAPVSDLVRLEATVAVLPGRLGANQGWWSQDPEGRVRFDWTGSCPVIQTPVLYGPAGQVLSKPSASMPNSVACARGAATALALPPGERILLAGTMDGAPWLATHRRRFVLSAESLQVLTETPESPLRGSAPGVDALRTRISDVDGVAYLSPPRLDLAGPGRVTVTGMATARQVEAVMDLQPWDPFDLGWIGWDRATRKVRFGSGASEVRLAPDQAIRDGRFLPLLPGHGAFLGEQEFSWINAAGIWRIRSGVEAQPVDVTPMPPVVALAHGKFLFARNGISVSGGPAVADTGLARVTQDDLVLVEDLRGRSIDGSLLVSGSAQPAFADRGFAFDDRRAVARRGDRVVVLTPLGLVPVDKFADAVQAPPGTDRLSIEGSVLMAGQGAATWLAETAPGNWTAAAVPGSSVQMARSDGRLWQRLLGRAEVVPEDPAQSWRVDPAGGLDFPTDRLLALAADAGGVVAITGAGTETARDLAALSTAQAPVANDPGSRLLDAQEISPGDPVLWAETQDGRLVWNRTSRAWASAMPGRQPWVHRDSALAGPIAVAFDAGRPVTDVLVTGLDGQMRRTGFVWKRGEVFPFDVARSLHVEGGRLLIGTDFGLRRLVETSAAATNDALFATAPGRPIPDWVEAIGRPTAAPAAILAETGRGDCLLLPGPASMPQTCPDASGLSQRLVLRTGEWEWLKSASRAEGRYLLSDGTAWQIPLPLGSRMPHDDLSDRATCAGRTVEVWAAQSISAERGSASPGRLNRLPDTRDLHCQEAGAFLGSGRVLSAGLYAYGAGGAELDGPSGWSAATAEEAQAVRERAEGGVPWESERLRIRLQDGHVAADLRRLDDRWYDLDWQSGRIALDRPIALARGGTGILALTTAGLVNLRDSHAPVIDPVNVLAASLADPKALGDCAPDRIETKDGRAQAAPAEPGDPVVMRCADGRVVSGAWLPNRDIGALDLQKDDPFVTRVLAEEPGLWRWTLEDALPGRAGVLAITFRDEAMSLSGGRLAIDDWHGLADVFPGQLEVVAADGWWVQAGGDLGLTAAHRAAARLDPTAVTRLWSAGPPGAPALCIDGSDRVSLDATGNLRRTEACREWTGQDPIWTWWDKDDGSLAEAPARNGPVVSRVLAAGRFSDIVASGAPMAISDGRLAVPTGIGATLIGRNGPEAIFAAAPGGVLAHGVGGTPVLIGAGMPIGVEGPATPECAALPGLVSRLPGETVLRRIEATGNAADLWLDANGDRLQIHVDCNSPADALAWSLPVEVSNRARFLAYPGENGILTASLQTDTMSFRLVPDLGIVAGLPVKGAPLSMVSAPDGRAIALVTRTDVALADTDTVLRALALGSGDLPPLVGVGDAAGQVDGAPAPSEPVRPRPKPVPETPVPKTSDQTQHQETAESLSSPVNAEPEPQEAVSQPPSTDPVAAVLDRNEWRNAQTALNRLGYAVGGVDGIPGKRTRAAIAKWQSASGAEPTGELTTEQFAGLLAEAGM